MADVDPPTAFAGVTALSFDCYGTLIDWEAGIVAALRPWVERQGAFVGDEDLLAVFGRHETVVQAEHPAMAYPRVLAQTMRRAGDELGLPTTDDDRQAFAASVADWPAFPDSGDALRRLGGRFRLIVLSNVDRRSFAASASRLGVAFDAVVTAEDVGAYKPDPVMFAALLTAVDGLGVDRGAIVHVAQSRYHDHEPAAAAGLPTVWIDRRAGRSGGGATPEPTAPVTPTWRFETLTALADAAGCP